MDPGRMDPGRTDPVRIGVLGAARIAPAALVRPAGRIEGVEVASVAARHPERAAEFAAKHRIGRTHASYAELVADPEIEAVYNALPNGLHGRWTLAALAAGKHVLCEKPFTANAAEAQTVARAAEAAGTVVMEAFHYRYHPLADRLGAIVGSGELGTVRHLEVAFSAPLARRGDIRYQLDLAGGALMDMGCYPVHLARLLGRGEPAVVAARAKQSSPGVDRAMTADLRFPGGTTGRIRCSMFSSSLLSMHATVEGDGGRLRVFNPFAPQFANKITVELPKGRRVERLTRRATYDFQLEAFRDAVRGGGPVLTDPADSIANMTVIDAVYEAADLVPRQPTA